jgi:DNA-binding NarL/FixJ family response regulator
MNGEETAILLTDSASLAMGLRALLLSIPPIQSVECLVDANALLERISSFHPALIVIDMALVSTRIVEVLNALSDHSPGSRRVLFTDDMDELRQLNYRHSETVIIKGADAARLADVFDAILTAPATGKEASAARAGQGPRRRQVMTS